MSMPNKKTSSRKGLKICCAFTSIFLAIFVIVSVILFFTVFKPKQPQVTAHPASLENIEFQIYPPRLNVTLGIVITIENRNYGSFKFKNTTAYVGYRGSNVAENPIEHETVPARGKLNVTTYASIRADKLALSQYLWDDVRAGRINLSSTAELHGKASVIKIFKIDATVYSTCDISVLIQSQDLESNCQSKIKL